MASHRTNPNAYIEPSTAFKECNKSYATLKTTSFVNGPYTNLSLVQVPASGSGKGQQDLLIEGAVRDYSASRAVRTMMTAR